jgi:hypothetical protein
VTDNPSKWGDYSHLVEFAYNNGHQDSLNMSPFEYLNGRIWNTPVTWDNPTTKLVLGLELFKDMEDQMVKIKQNLKET